MVSHKVKQIPGILFPGTSDVLWKSSHSPIHQVASCRNRRKIKGKQLKLACIFFIEINMLFSLAPKKTLLLAWLRSAFFNFYNEDAVTGVECGSN